MEGAFLPEDKNTSFSLSRFLIVWQVHCSTSFEKTQLQFERTALCSALK